MKQRYKTFKEKKLFLFADDIIVYLESPRE